MMPVGTSVLPPCSLRVAPCSVCVSPAPCLPYRRRHACTRAARPLHGIGSAKIAQSQLNCVDNQKPAAVLGARHKATAGPGLVKWQHRRPGGTAVHLTAGHHAKYPAFAGLFMHLGRRLARWECHGKVLHARALSPTSQSQKHPRACETGEISDIVDQIDPRWVPAPGKRARSIESTYPPDFAALFPHSYSDFQNVRPIFSGAAWLSKIWVGHD
jgi:hypothetical protein